MNPQDVEAWLRQTLEDHRMSRGERQTLAAYVEAAGPGLDRLDLTRRAFDMARSSLGVAEPAALLDWLETVVKVLREPDDAPSHAAEAYFSPGEDCRRAIEWAIRGAKSSLDVCVFTITDDHLADALIAAHRRGTKVRVVTDNDKAEDLGSDVDRIESAGVPTRVDRTPFHMHHKFALIDQSVLLTGSYNWTRGAFRDNAENLIVTGDKRLVNQYVAVFGDLWNQLA